MGAPLFPLLVLFGLNAVDELDRTAFAVLLPDIRDEFGLNLTGILGLVGVGVVRRACCSRCRSRCLRRPPQPRAHRLDRRARCGRASRFLTGLARRSSARHRPRGLRHRQGRRRPDPQLAARRLLHIPARPRVSLVPPRGQRGRGDHRPADGRAARPPRRLALAVHRLRVPDAGLRGARAAAAGAGPRRVRAAGQGARRGGATEEATPSFAERWRMVWKIESLRRIWYALPFLAVVARRLRRSLASLLYEQVFDLDERARGHRRRVRRAGAARRADHRRPHRHAG